MAGRIARAQLDGWVAKDCSPCLLPRLWMARLAGLYQSEISLLFDGLQTTSLVDLWSDHTYLIKRFIGRARNPLRRTGSRSAEPFPVLMRYIPAHLENYFSTPLGFMRRFGGTAAINKPSLRSNSISWYQDDGFILPHSYLYYLITELIPLW